MRFNAKTGRIIVAAFALSGAAVMTYLTTRHFAGSSSSLCNFGARFSCDLVNKSTFSAIVGVPISVLGIGYFVFVAGLALQKKFDAMAMIVYATVFSLAFGAYLSLVEIRLLGSVCVFCEAAKLLMIGILAAAYATANPAAKKPRPTWLAASIAAAALMSYAAYALSTK